MQLGKENQPEIKSSGFFFFLKYSPASISQEHFIFPATSPQFYATEGITVNFNLIIISIISGINNYFCDTQI